MMSNGAVPQKSNGNPKFNKIIIILTVVVMCSLAAVAIYYSLNLGDALFDCYYYIEGEISTCSYEKEPVCAKIEASSSEFIWKEFDNACQACLSGESIIGYLGDTCEYNNKVQTNQ